MANVAGGSGTNASAVATGLASLLARNSDQPEQLVDVNEESPRLSWFVVETPLGRFNVTVAQLD